MHFRRIYEINTRVWLWELMAQGTLRQPHLGAIPEVFFRTWQRWRIDAVWLMGVWEPSPYGAQVARHEPQLVERFRQALDDYTPEDCIGSPYAVRRYEVADQVGGRAALQAFRIRLREVGIGLILDFVPNHTACDHPWVRDHPAYYVQGSATDAARTPEAYFQADTVDGRRYIAHGRDPYFPPWTDTAQLNYAHPAVHEAMQEELRRIARWCDGVRCDMAMLCLPEVFTQTWPQATSPQPHEFWAEAIQAVHRRVPEFCFIAEVYWGLDARLQQLGFTMTYDKAFYDALVARDTAQLSSLLHRQSPMLERGLRFLENHDEARAATRFSIAQAAAATLALLTLPGAVLFHDGQIEGRRYHTPVQLRRRRAEPMQPSSQELYERLFAVPTLHHGTFHPLHPRMAWEGNQTFHNMLAWGWWNDTTYWLVVINNADVPAQCSLHLPHLPASAERLRLRDHWGDIDETRSRVELEHLYIELPPCGCHLFEITPADVA